MLAFPTPPTRADASSDLATALASAPSAGRSASRPGRMRAASGKAMPRHVVGAPSKQHGPAVEARASLSARSISAEITRGSHVRPLLRRVAALLLPVTLGCSSTSEPAVKLNTFDSNTWKDVEQTNQEPFARRPMADELVRQRALHGKTRQEVLEMLGDPTDTGYFADYDAVYWLGPQRGFLAMDSEWLVIRFDESGHVTEAAIKTD
jgi:hypothetical protein